jgi:hypothetical protein
MKKTAKYYNSEKGSDSYAKKLAYDKAYNAKPDRIKYRSELNEYNRKSQAAGKSKKNDGLDATHKGGKIVGMEKASTNRGRKEKSRLKGSKRN